MMKHILLIACLFFTTQVFAGCQPSTVEKYTQEFMTKLDHQVELTADQKQAMTTALKTNIADREDVLMTYKGQTGIKVKREIQKQLESINANLQSEAQEILTPQQYSTFLDIQGQNQAAVRERVKENY